MKTREQKQRDLEALAEQLRQAQAAMFVGFKNMTVAKDQELRNTLRQAGAQYAVVKNTLARKAAEGTPYEQASAHFKGVTAVAAWNCSVSAARSCCFCALVFITFGPHFLTSRRRSRLAARRDSSSPRGSPS